MRFPLALLALAVAAGSSPAADAEQEFVRKVNRAIEKGKSYLIQQEAGKGNWENTIGELVEMTGGQTALATLALLNAGVPADDKVIQRALAFLRDVPRTRTYVVGLTTMAFAEARQPADLPRIQANADWLIDNAVKSGGKVAGWSYPRQGGQFPDGSNTQYALLGLYAARQSGAKIPDPVWVQIREFYEGTAKDDGPASAFWTYDMTQKLRGGASLTMTVAGVCGLLIADMGLNRSEQQLNETTGVAGKCGLYSTSAKVEQGLNFVASRFDFGIDKGKPRPSWLKSAYYNVYGMERLGRLSGQRFIGRYDWYREGCERLVELQNPDGTWKGEGLGDSIPTVATSFAVLFLSKGRTPVLVTKFAHGESQQNDAGQLLERGDNPGVTGWNRKRNDARHLTEFASRELFQGMPLGWQVYDGRRVNLDKDDLKVEVEALLACPLVYMNGHQRPFLNGQQKDLLKRYVDEGGFLFAEACCGSPAFADGFAELMKELFPENELVPMPPEHPLWRAFYQVSPADFPGVMMLDRGCKTVVVFSKTPVAGFWEEVRFQPKKGVPAANRGERAYQFGGNVIAYATGMQPPEQKGFRVKVADAKEASPPRGAFIPAQLRLSGEAPPAPAAMRNLVGYARDAFGLEASFDPKKPFAPGDPELVKYKFLYLHGRKAVTFTDDELGNLRAALETGGLLFADAACGKKEFDAAFRQMAAKLYPEAKLEPIPLDDELFSAKLNGTAVRTVKRREKADGTGPDGGYRDLPPALEGIKIDGRWVVIYSKFDIGCSLERRVSTDCLGHTPDSAMQLCTAAVLYSLKR